MGAVSLALAAYVNAVDNPFVGADADTILSNRSLVEGTDLRLLLRYDAFHPLVNLSFALDRALWGFTSFGFHVTNIVLHTIAVGLFYGWCTRAFADAHRGEPSIAPDWPAFGAAALFAAHPLLTGTVDYVSARGELLCAIGVLGALIMARRALQSQRRAAAAAAVGAALFAVAAKETALALPFILLAYDAWVWAPSVHTRGVAASRWRTRLWTVYAPAFALVAVAAVVRAWTLMPVIAGTERGPLTNLLTEAIVIWRYGGLLLAPREQSFVHDVRVVTSAADAAGLLAFAALVALAALTPWIARRVPLVAVGIVWFLAALLPSSSVIALPQLMAEHRAYLGSAGVFMAAAALVARPLATRAAVRAVACAAAIACVAVTTRRNVVWSSELTIWEEAVTRSSHWEAHYGYANALRQIGRCDRAVEEYRAVLAVRPDHAGARRGVQACGR